MKNSILYLSALILCSTQAFSQGIGFGIKAGYNYSNFSIDNASADARSGFMAGAFVKVKVASKFAIQPEVLFMQRGSRFTYNEPSVQGAGDFTFNYIDVPVLFVFSPIKVLNLHFGPYASYLTSINIKNVSSGQYNFEQIKRSQFNDWDYGLAAGVGFDVLFVTGGIRYNQGFSKVGNSSGGFTFANGRNNVTTLFVGFTF